MLIYGLGFSGREKKNYQLFAIVIGGDERTVGSTIRYLYNKSKMKI